MAQEALVTNHEDGGVQLTRRLTLGCELSCTTNQGDTFRGNLVAHDEKENLIVISILRYLPPCMWIHVKVSPVGWLVLEFLVQVQYVSA